MRLIKRKHPDDDAAVRCPNCEERAPEGARRCTMCGRDLDDVSGTAERERADDAYRR